MDCTPGLYTDPQTAPVVDTCPRCGGELYDPASEPGTLCPACEGELRRYHQPTLQAVMEELDFQLQKYLSDDLRNTIYNTLATKFNLED